MSSNTSYPLIFDNTMTIDRKKSVRFVTSAPIYYDSPQRKGKSGLWMSKEEYKDVRLHEMDIIQQVCLGVFVESDEDSFRGLEIRTMQGKRRLAGVQEVIQEQTMQASLGNNCYKNHQLIAQIFIQCTREARKMAYNMAKEDARMANAIHQEKNLPSQHTEKVHRRPSILLKKAKSFCESMEFSVTPPRIFRRHYYYSNTHHRPTARSGCLSSANKTTLFASSFVDMSTEGMNENCRFKSDCSVTNSCYQVTKDHHTPSVTPSRCDSRDTLELSKRRERSACIKTSSIPSRIPFVGEPSLLTSHLKMKHDYKNSTRQSPRLLKRPSLDRLLRTRLNKQWEEGDDDDMTAPTETSIESTGSFRMKSILRTRVRM